jgi:hypothetical protein
MGAMTAAGRTALRAWVAGMRAKHILRKWWARSPITGEAANALSGRGTGAGIPMTATDRTRLRAWSPVCAQSILCEKGGAVAGYSRSVKRIVRAGNGADIRYLLLVERGFGRGWRVCAQSISCESGGRCRQLLEKRQALCRFVRAGNGRRCAMTAADRTTIRGSLAGMRAKHILRKWWARSPATREAPRALYNSFTKGMFRCGLASV